MPVRDHDAPAGGGPDLDRSDDELRRHLPVSQVLHPRLRQQVEALRAADLEIRRDEPEGVHDARVASRRLRAAMAAFRPAFDTVVTEPLREELRWLARSLGAARDLHVVRERLLVLAEQEVEDAGPLLVRLASAEWSGHDSGAVLEVLESQRYGDLVRALDALVADPPWTARAHDGAGSFVRRRLRKEWARLDERVALTADLEPGAALDASLHDVRKAAKRLRYALEVAELQWRRKPKRLRRHIHHLTDVLGERQDSSVTRAVLLELAALSEAVGEPTAIHSRLDRVEEERAAELEAEFRDGWSAAVRQRRAWP